MFSQKLRLNNKGFSLLEMTVVLAIVGIMTVVVLLDLPRMKGGLSIDLVAQEVAIYIRGAQVYSRATKVSGITYNSYGIHFTKNSSEFFLWADADNSIEIERNPLDFRFYSYKSYNEEDTKQEIYNLPAGFIISKIKCGGHVLSSSLDIVFRLPDPEAIFSGLPAQSHTGFIAPSNPCETSLKASVCLQSANQQQWLSL